MHLARFAFAILPVAAGLVAQPVWAVQARWLTQTEILQQFNGATIDGRYASGKAFTERYAVDGRLFYREARLTLGGHWSVTGGTLCTIYDFDASGGCYRVARVDTNCYEFYFVSRTEAAAPGPRGSKPSWTARGALQGKASACRDAPSV
ncbi:hypothetical protein [Hyphomicrobium sp.]|jgi:hypothetical protein|uniref:hypothetical protein n=1 Tax=Hyphomicrobium sp. TaxID=82 RepID=UPI002CB845B3|nr:hypothetical protein [Hyphomicrobium sp.]HVZ05520.1 hypothetical protein [Hyphomicrobium sp.]